MTFEFLFLIICYFCSSVIIGFVQISHIGDFDFRWYEKPAQFNDSQLWTMDRKHLIFYNIKNTFEKYSLLINYFFVGAFEATLFIFSDFGGYKKYRKYYFPLYQLTKGIFYLIGHTPIAKKNKKNNESILYFLNGKVKFYKNNKLHRETISSDDLKILPAIDFRNIVSYFVFKPTLDSQKRYFFEGKETGQLNIKELNQLKLKKNIQNI